MSYAAEISRNNPSCFLLLIDQSGSMDDPWPGEAGQRKADALATIVNRLLQNLVLKCAKSEGVRDYYEVGVIGYGSRVGPAFSGPLAGKNLVRISEIADSPARIENRTRRIDDGVGGLTEQTVKFPIWFDAVAANGTPMCQAMNMARTILGQWIGQHPTSFPPIVINVTDGESTDGDATESATAIKNLSTNDGSVLLFNVHVSSTPGTPIEFPADDVSLPDDYAKLLFRISSALPDYMRLIAQQEGVSVSDGTRGFVFNADMVTVIRFLDIGTRPSNLR